MSDKSKAQRAHAIRRARERYGIDLNRDQYTALCASLRKGAGIFLGRQSNRLTVWRLVVAERACNVVYDKQRGTIVTFLPLDITNAHGVLIPS